MPSVLICLTEDPPDPRAKCPLCGSVLKWSCNDVDGRADCQNGNMVSRRLNADGEMNPPERCLWSGCVVTRGPGEHVFAQAPLPVGRFFNFDEAKGRRAKACAHFKWLNGMQYATDGGPAGWGFGRVKDPFDWPLSSKQASTADEDSLPVVDDPATLGCIYELVRLAWRARRVYVEPTKDGRFCVRGLIGYEPFYPVAAPVQRYGTSEIDALLTALETVPWLP